MHTYIPQLSPAQAIMHHAKASMVPLAALGILNTYDPESTYYRIAVAKPEGIVVSMVNWILGNST